MGWQVLPMRHCTTMHEANHVRGSNTHSSTRKTSNSRRNTSINMRRIIDPRVEQRGAGVATEAEAVTILSTLTLTTVPASPTMGQSAEDLRAHIAHPHDKARMALTAKALHLPTEADVSETALATTSTACLCQTLPRVSRLSRLLLAVLTNSPCTPCRLFLSNSPCSTGIIW